MDTDKMLVTALDFSFAINKAYERGLNRGLQGYVAQLSFEDVLRQSRDLRAEYDRRVSKALATARASWEASLDMSAALEPIPGELDAAEGTDHE